MSHNGGVFFRLTPASEAGVNFSDFELRSVLPDYFFQPGQIAFAEQQLPAGHVSFSEEHQTVSFGLQRDGAYIFPQKYLAVVRKPCMRLLDQARFGDIDAFFVPYHHYAAESQEEIQPCLLTVIALCELPCAGKQQIGRYRGECGGFPFPGFSCR